MTEKYRIVINGWYGQHNAGDDAILDIFLQYARSPESEITVLSEFPERIQNVSGVQSRPHPVAFGRGACSALLNGSLWRHLRLIAGADLFVLGGGGLLRDNTNWRNLLRLLDEIWLAKICGRKVMLYAIGVGPFRTRLGKWLIGTSVRLCDLVTVRSERCAALLREIGVAAEKIHVVADPAFLLPLQPSSNHALRVLVTSGKRLIGFYPTIMQAKRKDDQEHLDLLAAALDRISQEQDADIVAVPMSVLDSGEDDVLVANLVRARMRYPERMHVCTTRLTAQEVKWVTAQMTLNITVRLHAMIFSLGAGVPAVALNYEPKVANVFAAYDMPECLVPIDGAIADSLPAAVGRCSADLQGYTTRIRARRTETTIAAARTFEQLRALIQEEEDIDELSNRRLSDD